MKSTLTFLFASCLIMLMASYRQANVPGTHMDTIPKPTYEYGYRSFIPINQLQPTLDTINMIMENFGVDMMGSRSKALKELFNQKMGVLLGRIVVDSVKVGGKP